MAGAVLFVKLSTESEKRMPQYTHHIEILLKEGLDERWAEWFAGFDLAETPEGGTFLSGEVPDRAALHGILDYIRDLNLSLVTLQVRDLPKKG